MCDGKYFIASMNRGNEEKMITRRDTNEAY